MTSGTDDGPTVLPVEEVRFVYVEMYMNLITVDSVVDPSTKMDASCFFWTCVVFGLPHLVCCMFCSPPSHEKDPV